MATVAGGLHLLSDFSCAHIMIGLSTLTQPFALSHDRKGATWLEVSIGSNATIRNGQQQPKKKIGGGQ